MQKPSRTTFIIGATLVALIAITLVALSGVQRAAPTAISLSDNSAPALNPPIMSEEEINAQFISSELVQHDTCLHCHLSGTDENMWTPSVRWSAFGLSFLFLTFGLYRSASIWTTRQPWQPLRKRVAAWIDARYQIAAPLEKALNKPVPRYALRWWYCLGGITAFLFVVQAVTGIMLAFYYKPTPAEAYNSIQFIETEVYFGAGIRAIHHWAANGMVVMCLAHMVRVYINGAYKAPRELNWIGGMVLLIATLAFGFTGYLLPWDQRAYWATTVGTEIAGSIPIIGEPALVLLRVGWDVADVTLSRFYALHVIVLPITTIVMMGMHFLMIRRQGIAKPL